MLVLGVGFGIFLLLILWVTAAITILACGRSHLVVSVAVTSLAFVVTLILLLIPQHPSPKQPQTEEEDIDALFIPRVLIVIITGLAALGAFALLAIQWMEPVIAKPLKKIKF